MKVAEDTSPSWAESTEAVRPHAGAAGAALAGQPGALAPLLRTAVEALATGAARRGGPLPSGGPLAVTAEVSATIGRGVPHAGVGAVDALAELGELLAAGSADPVDPACSAHLHCPPLAVAVAADTIVAALNQSLDSWDQAPAASSIEEQVIAAMAELVGYDPATAGGVITSGGTESNLMGVLLARDASRRNSNGGVPRIFCSELAHFSIARSAGFVGIGEDAVIHVAVDDGYRMDAVALDEAITGAERRGYLPLAVVATAGSTDVGSIDPLPAVARVAEAHGSWLHVDAAYGGGALFSDRLAGLLDGLGNADSVSVDLHKLGWQPVPAGVFLTRRRTAFEPLSRSVAYLNPPDDEAAGYPSRLGFSLRTTRRADAFKIAVTMRALGRAGLGELVDRCHDLTLYAAERIAAHPRLELFTAPVLTTALFTYLTDDPVRADEVNAELRRRLLFSGAAVIGRTELLGATRLRLTLLNPHTTPDDVDRLLWTIVAAGRAVEAESPCRGPNPIAGDQEWEQG